MAKTRQLDLQKLRSAMEVRGFNQAQLAQWSGLSRAQISRLVSRGLDFSLVHSGTITKLAKALRLNEVDLAPGGREEQYRQWVAHEYGFIDFRGIGMPQCGRQPIDEVFVEPNVMDQPYDDGCDVTLAEKDCPIARSAPVGASYAILKRDRLVVLGNPGSGKTTLLRWIARQAARSEFREKGVPLLLRLSDLSRALEIDSKVDPISFVACMATNNDGEEVEDFLRNRLADDRNPCFVLLDGLDEVGNEERRGQLMDAVNGFVAHFPRNHFVVTSRIVGFDSSPWVSAGFSIVRLLGYDDPKLKEFIDKWARVLVHVFERTEQQIQESLKTAIFSNARIRALASNPLVLTLLVLLNESRGGVLPRRRVDLYAKVVEMFLDTWERTKSPDDGLHGASRIDLDAREFGWLLSDLALALQRNRRTLAPRWWIADRMRHTLRVTMGLRVEDAADIVERILRYLTRRAGLLDERGPDQFAFSHRTLHEYFAARGVIDEADASETRNVCEMLKGFLYDPHWQEVVRLVAAVVTPPVAESLITSILDDPDPVGRFLHRGPLLALRCLSDGATVPNPNLVSRAFGALIDLGRSKWLGITLEAFEVLETLENSRHESVARTTASAILESARKVLDDESYAFLFLCAPWSTARTNGNQRADGDSHARAAFESVFDIDGKSFPIIHVNTRLQVESPDTWFASACALLRDPSQSARLKIKLVWTLSKYAMSDRKARLALRKLLDSDLPASVRTQCALALSRAGGKKDARFLLRIVDGDDDFDVRGACATALGRFAVTDLVIREKLLAILKSNASVELRAGAARGLTQVAGGDVDTASALLATANDQSTDGRIRRDCAWALEERLRSDDEVVSAFKTWLQEVEGAPIRRVAAQSMANVMAEERVPWDQNAAERIEYVLLNLKDPCQHALDALEALATAREVRRGWRLESILRENLAPISDRIELAFVFGSTARKRQTEDSDVDLMIIGTVTLKDLSTPLRIAERQLGRRINPAIYSRESFTQRYQSGDPFLLDVYRREKLPVIFPPQTTTTRRGLDDELRAMVAERLAATT